MFKQRFYSELQYWALKRWRKQVKSPDIRRVRGKLSTHALIRYIERVENINTEKIADIILSEEALDKIGEIGGNGKFTLNGISYVVLSGVIITAYPHHLNKPTEVRIKPDGAKVVSYE